MRVIFLFTLAWVALSCGPAKPDAQREIEFGNQEPGADMLLDFESETADSIPNHWAGVTSQWKIVEDDGTKALKQGGESRGDLFNICVEKDHQYRNLEMRVRIKAISGTMDQGGGLIWHFKNPRNYYLVRANPLEGDIRAYHVVDGYREILATSKSRTRAGTWFTLAIAAKSTSLECYLNDKVVLTLSDSAFADAGLVGFWTKADAISLFDNLSIKVLE